jgi:hypothetical protein
MVVHERIAWRDANYAETSGHLHVCHWACEHVCQNHPLLLRIDKEVDERVSAAIEALMAERNM